MTIRISHRKMAMMMMISTSSSNSFARTISSMIVDGTSGLIIFVATILISLPLVLRMQSHLEELAETRDREEIVTAVGKIAPASSEETFLKSISYQRVAGAPDSTPTKHPELPMVDNYEAYRHQLIEATLRKHYNENYAPGKLLFNFIQLNAPDSTSDEILSRKYEAGFFDHMNDASQDGSTIFVNPLDHFIPNRVKTAETVDRETGTDLEMEPASEVPGMEGEMESRCQTPTSTVKIRAGQRNVKNMRCLVKSPIVLNNSLSPMGSSFLLSENTICEVYSSVKNNFLDPNGPKTEQLYRRDEPGSGVDSKTHVDTRKFLKGIAKDKNPAKRTL